MSVEGVQSGLQAGRQFQGIEVLAFAASLLGHVLADVLPQVAEHRHFVAGDVLGDRDARQLDDPALDRVHEREVAHRPWEQRALGIAGAAQEERRGGEVDDAAHAELAVDGFEAGNPQARRLVALLSLFLIVALKLLVIGLLRLLTVTVVRLVVDDEDVLHSHQIGHHPLQHLPFRLLRVQLLASAPLQQLAAALGKLDALAQLERVEVRDDDLCPLHIIQHIAGDELATGVVAVGIAREKDAQAVLDGQSGSADEKTAREVFAPGTPHGVNRLPCNEHGHHRGLAGPGGELESDAHQLGVGVLVGGGEMIQQTLASARLGCDLGEPDRSFRRFYLAEERTHGTELMMAPMLKQPRRLGRDLPLAGIFQRAPCVHMPTHLVDDRGGVVLLLLRRETFAFIEDEGRLRGHLVLLWLWNRRNEFCAASAFDDLLCRLPRLVELPIPVRVVVRGVENRLIEKRIGHGFRYVWVRLVPPAYADVVPAAQRLIVFHPIWLLLPRPILGD